MPLFNPTKVRLLRCTIKGVDARLHCNGITVYEDMCKPYITATVHIVDNANMINALELQRGDQIDFAFDTGFGTYRSTQYLLDIPKEMSTKGLRTMVYDLMTATAGYFNDRANMVQRADVNVPASSVAASIHNEFIGTDAPLRMLVQTVGLIAKTDIGGFQTTNKHPFKAIQDILDRAVFPGYPSGTPVYFRDRDSYVIAPLEHLFATMSPQEHFVQKATWGSDWRHTFADSESRFAIIAAKTILSDQESSGRGSAGNVTAALKGSINMFDIAQGTELLRNLGQSGGIGGALNRFASGRIGGIPNVLQMDTRRNEPSTEQGMNSIIENAFKARVKNATAYLVKVPIQSGISCTIGKGAHIRLLPPVGDQQSMGRQRVGGLGLLSHLMHECWFDNRSVQGTTTFRLVQLE